MEFKNNSPLGRVVFLLLSIVKQILLFFTIILTLCKGEVVKGQLQRSGVLPRPEKYHFYFLRS